MENYCDKESVRPLEVENVLFTGGALKLESREGKKLTGAL